MASSGDRVLVRDLSGFDLSIDEDETGLSISGICSRSKNDVIENETKINDFCKQKDQQRTAVFGLEYSSGMSQDSKLISHQNSEGQVPSGETIQKPGVETKVPTLSSVFCREPVFKDEFSASEPSLVNVENPTLDFQGNFDAPNFAAKELSYATARNSGAGVTHVASDISDIQSLPPPAKKPRKEDSTSFFANDKSVLSMQRPSVLLPTNQLRPTDVSIQQVDDATLNTRENLSLGLDSVSSADTKLDCDGTFARMVNLDPIPHIRPLLVLSPREIAELELALQIGDKFSRGDDNSWRDDWSGNLQLIDKDLVMNRAALAQNPHAKPVLLPFCDWAAKASSGSSNIRAIELLFSYVYHMKGTPQMAQKILAYSLQRPASSVSQRLQFALDGVKRITYDPTVLRQDGWTTKKADHPEGSSGGAFLIGRRVIWHRYEAIIIAFVKDDEIGDLWKAIWLEDHDTFDLEADELQEGLKKYEKKLELKQKKANANRGPSYQSNGGGASSALEKRTRPATSIRFEASRQFTVEGIEHGIVLASSYVARQGVRWPARVMHASEIKALGPSQASRRSSSKNEIYVVFFAPCWNGQYAQTARSRVDAKSGCSQNAKDVFSTGSLFQIETIDVSDDTIQKYPYDAETSTLSIDKIRAEFRFLGLPKSAFSRYLDSHRLATAFKTYARKEHSNNAHNDATLASAFASLTDSHPMTVMAPQFPPPLLNLPYEYILSKFPHPSDQVSQLIGEDGEEMTEPIMQLHLMLKAMLPPFCWGKRPLEKTMVECENEPLMLLTPKSNRAFIPIRSPDVRFSSTRPDPKSCVSDNGDASTWSLTNFASSYLIDYIGGVPDGEPALLPVFQTMGKQVFDLVSRLKSDLEATEGTEGVNNKAKHRAFLSSCLAVKGRGEDAFYAEDIPPNVDARNLTIEWRKACERIFKRATVKFSQAGYGNGVTAIITDNRCNQHLTASGSYERAVRLPAAIRGAKKAGAGLMANIPIVTTVEDKYMELAENKILPKAHKASYLKRMKAKISAIAPEKRGEPLTDDSDGEGGEDTMGSRGSYTAAVTAVAAALKGLDMIVSGECVNAFCAVRPPGHHAGTELRAMNAISNGFCLLNAAASAALYATTHQSEGGLGLKRVCVIDFDVHHGNGTQDILCSTHDSRFLYVSTHAGGAHINGFDDDEAYELGGGRRSLGGGKNEGIFPGRCGDTSPHEGVLNIPLGQKVTAQSIGNALVSKVSPAVEAFAPDLVILSAGFDAHKNDPLGMGGLTAEDFGSVTAVVCQMAMKSCSGRVLSLLEGGYGVPCCRPRRDLFLPDSKIQKKDEFQDGNLFNILDLGEDIPASMEDDVQPSLLQRLDKCYQEGFLECVHEHVKSLAKYNNRDIVRKVE